MDGSRGSRGTCERANRRVLALSLSPEAILGGLADHAVRPAEFAFEADGARLTDLLAALASRTVTTMIGFTEILEAIDGLTRGRCFQDGAVIGCIENSIRRSTGQCLTRGTRSRFYC
jgi:hypothetical protein